MSARARFLRQLDEAHSDAEAIEHEAAWTTWGRLRHLAESLEVVLRDRGLGAGSRIGVVLENRPEHVAMLLAAVATDRCVVTLSGLQPPERLVADVVASAVPVLIASPEMLERPGFREAAGQAVVLGLHPEQLELVADADVTGHPASPGVVVEMLTSGTTGPPKRVLLTDRQFDAALFTSVPEPPRGRALPQWGDLGDLAPGAHRRLLGSAGPNLRRPSNRAPRQVPAGHLDRRGPPVPAPRHLPGPGRSALG